MKALKIASVLPATAIVLLALPATAGAQYVVPPGNSAVNQYTETVPTAGGNQEANRRGNGNRSPAEVLGERNARRLNAHGSQGQAAAEVAAAAAPGVSASSPAAIDAQSTAKHRQRQGGEGDPRRAESTPSGNSPSSDSSGSSGIGEVIGQATGSSSGEMGLFLPLVILGAIAWALGYLWRQRRPID